MPLLDLSNADAVRWNGKDVSVVRLNGADIWVPTSIPDSPAFSIFGSTVPVALSSHDDADVGAWLSTQFYIPSPVDYVGEVYGVRILVPEGSTLIGQSGRVALTRRTMADGGPFTTEIPVTDYNTNGTKTELPTPLVAGWNEIELSASYPFTPGDAVVLGYQIGSGNYYLYTNALTWDPILDNGARGVYMAEVNIRSYYQSAEVDPTWYGIDIMFRDV